MLVVHPGQGSGYTPGVTTSWPRLIKFLELLLTLDKVS